MPFLATAAGRPLRPAATSAVRRVELINARSLLTPASGFLKGYKFSLNPYSGCGFGCSYCYARFFAQPEERDSWGEWVRVKRNAVELLQRAMGPGGGRQRLLPGDAIAMSTATDPYQPIEAKLKLTRSLVEALLPLQPRLTVQTRSPVAARDVDLFAGFDAIRVNFSIPTDSEEVRLRYEPHAPAIHARLEAAAAVARAGVPVGICVSPMLPVEDPEGFARRIAAVGPGRCSATAFYRSRQEFAANTSEAALELARADGWTKARFEETVTRMQAVLGPELPLRDASRWAPPEARTLDSGWFSTLRSVASD